MTEPRPLLTVGLTGGIASGKSTVAACMARQGAYVVDADRITHQVTSPGGAAFDDVVGRFGVEILDSEGRIDRRALGRVVFGDAGVRRALEALVHPRVRTEIQGLIEAYRREDGGPMVVVDAALLVETGFHESFDRVVVVTCRLETQIRRLHERDGLGLEEAEARIQAQAPIETKLAVADYVIDTEDGHDETRSRTRAVYAKLMKEFEERSAS